MKSCSTCKEQKDISNFSKNRAQKDGLANVCKPCFQVVERLSRRRNPGRTRNEWLKYSYGITSAQYDKLLVKQKGSCAICKSIPTKKRLAVDHDHSTGKIRGLLCHPCNAAIGLFKDNTDFLLEAKRYLEGAR